MQVLSKAAATCIRAGCFQPADPGHRNDSGQAQQHPQPYNDDLKLMIGRLLAHHARTVARNLREAEFKAFSQFGDDGIIQFLVSRLNLTDRQCQFVEFGVENYKEANTRFLLLNDNWRGLVLDSAPANIESIKQEDIYWRHDLTAATAWIDRDNINSIIESNGFSSDIGLLSIDIDGNDYWILERIDVVSPIILIVEYNSIFQSTRAVTIPYDSAFNRTRAHSSNLYWGASIAALDMLARRKGYFFIGCNRNIGGIKPVSIAEGYVESKFRGEPESVGRCAAARTHTSKGVPGREYQHAGKKKSAARGVVGKSRQSRPPNGLRCGRDEVWCAVIQVRLYQQEHQHSDQERAGAKHSSCLRPERRSREEDRSGKENPAPHCNGPQPGNRKGRGWCKTGTYLGMPGEYTHQGGTQSTQDESARHGRELARIVGGERTLALAAKVPDQFRRRKRQHHNRPRRRVYGVVLEKHLQRPCDVAIGGRVRDIQPKHDAVFGVERLRFLRESRRIGCEVATDESVVDIAPHNVPTELGDELRKKDNGRREGAGKLSQADPDCEAVVTGGKNEIQKDDSRDVNIEDSLVVEERYVERVDNKQRVRLLLLANAVRDV
jgi:hypothetical protein